MKRARSSRNIEAPFFRYYLHGKDEKPNWQASTFQSARTVGIVCVWREEAQATIYICTRMARCPSPRQPRGRMEDVS